MLSNGKALQLPEVAIHQIELSIDCGLCGSAVTTLNGNLSTQFMSTELTMFITDGFVD
jgi:hypothetical protein